MPEPMEPFVEWQPPLFLQASEIIHDKRESVGFWALVKIIEIHDFTSCEDSSDDGSRSDSSDDGLPGPQVHSSLRPWPMIYHFIIASSPSGPWPCLPRHGGDVQWSPQVTWAPHASNTADRAKSYAIMVALLGKKDVLQQQQARGKALCGAHASVQGHKATTEVTEGGMSCAQCVVPSVTV
jgi:hypothetical protein